ncbi:hypothetical protein BH23BAC1_BH23BAC1_20610 [soil metagenome]
MKNSLVRKINLIFIFTILAFCGLFLITFQSLKFSKDSSELVTQTQEVIYQIERVLSNTIDVETAHRGFIITGNEVYLEPIDNAKYEIFSAIGRLKNIKADDPQQLQKIDSLHLLVKSKLELSDYGVNLRRQSAESALNFVSTGKGRAIMNDIRNTCKYLEQTEMASLNERSSQNENNVLANYRNFLIFSVFSLVLIFIFYSRIKDNTLSLITYRKKQDELINELNYQNKQLDDFAHITSHNIRSPASNIYTLISLLKKNSTIDEYKLIFEKLTKVSKNLNETLNELVEVLHVKKDVGIEKQIIAFEHVSGKIQDSLQGEILKHRVYISIDFSRATHILYPNTYLESIFHNLLSNAIKYRAPGRVPRISLSTEIEDNSVIFKVSDNGLGIDLNKYGSKIFGLRKIFHSHADAKGIGLFMTKAQIETLGGKISVESEVDKGSTFKIIFSPENTVLNPPKIKRRFAYNQAQIALN